jgi:hypothetical protein
VVRTGEETDYMSTAATDRMVTRRRNGKKVGALQRQVKELRQGVCSAGTCEKVRGLRGELVGRGLAAASELHKVKETLHNYRQDAPHVVAVLDAEETFLSRIWFAVNFVLFGLSRKSVELEVPQW